MAIIGYVRVSTDQQSTAMQRDVMERLSPERIFEDVGYSGSKASRPGLDAAMEYLRPGDTLSVWRLDRLGRSTVNVLNMIKELADKGIGFQSLTEGIDTTTAQGRMLLTILAAFAEMEREILIERTRVGLDAARARGKVGGRKRSLTHKQREQVMKLYRSQTMTIKEIAAAYSVSEPTIYRTIAELKATKK